MDSNLRQRFTALVNLASEQLAALTAAVNGGGSPALVRQARDDVNRSLTMVERMLADSDDALLSILDSTLTVKAALDKRRDDRANAVQEVAKQAQADMNRLVADAARDQELLRVFATSRSGRDPKWERTVHERAKGLILAILAAQDANETLQIGHQGVREWAQRARIVRDEQQE